MSSVASGSASASGSGSGSASATNSGSGSGSGYGPSRAFSFANPQFQTDKQQSAPTGPHASQLMDTIRDVAVFAWGIVGINRSLERYKYGTPSGDAQPKDAFIDGA
ncbi:hypothetical protein N7481_011381 [Penicillium waksmanii]|uniref:uncharacterized protein n=1 Tax=Penicillium waksmanii TaxID=69791 RepID=UPI0025473F4D|nr:uncharacterized protein N7481_011381 [Penicillium waksmanii]KAJ5974171.1 hypothetical protein N7481_011381 [Penicillium waksmanii]